MEHLNRPNDVSCGSSINILIHNISRCISHCHRLPSFTRCDTAVLLAVGLPGRAPGRLLLQGYHDRVVLAAHSLLTEPINTRIILYYTLSVSMRTGTGTAVHTGTALGMVMAITHVHTRVCTKHEPNCPATPATPAITIYNPEYIMLLGSSSTYIVVVAMSKWILKTFLL